MRSTAHARNDQGQFVPTQAKVRRRSKSFAIASVLALGLAACGQGAETIQSKAAPAGSSDASQDQSPLDDAPESTGGGTETPVDSTQGSETQQVTPEDPTPDDVEDPPTPAPEDAEPIGDPVPDEASIEQIKVVMEDLHGPTTDVAGQMNRLAPFAAVPTPLGASITATSVRTNTSFETRIRYTEVTFSASGTVDDLTTFYQTSLAAFDWKPITESESTNNGIRTMQFSFEMGPKIGGIPDEFTVTLVEQSEGGTEVNLKARESSKADEPSELATRFARWQGETPLPDDGRIHEWSVATTKYTGHKLRLTAKTAYDGQSQQQLFDHLIENLPTADYAVDQEKFEGRPVENWFDAKATNFEDASFRVSEIDLSSGLVGYVEIEGNLDFVPNR